MNITNKELVQSIMDERKAMAELENKLLDSTNTVDALRRSKEHISTAILDALHKERCRVQSLERTLLEYTDPHATSAAITSSYSNSNSYSNSESSSPQHPFDYNQFKISSSKSSEPLPYHINNNPSTSRMNIFESPLDEPLLVPNPNPNPSPDSRSQLSHLSSGDFTIESLSVGPRISRSLTSNGADAAATPSPTTGVGGGGSDTDNNEKEESRMSLIEDLKR